ncbi:MAG: DUF2508 family protein [Oscillospiraceae bacterium]|jgi:hypothetical protein|nr:DUF2508 family protein [Oscillospiraceae bacterium]
MEHWLAARVAAIKTKRAPEEPNPNAQLVLDIRALGKQIEQTHSLLSMETDDDLLDAAIYQLKALRAQYRYLLRLAHEVNLVVRDLPITEEDRERLVQ